MSRSNKRIRPSSILHRRWWMWQCRGGRGPWVEECWAHSGLVLTSTLRHCCRAQPRSSAVSWFWCRLCWYLMTRTRWTDVWTHHSMTWYPCEGLLCTTISGGFQKTNYGLSDSFQTDTSFYCSSYSLGFGARIHFSEALNMDIAYFWTNYDDYTKNEDAYYSLPNIKGSNVYSRTNKVFGVSLNYNF